MASDGDGGSEQVLIADDAGTSGDVADGAVDGTTDGSHQILVRQLADGSLITADGQRLVFSKDDITEIQFSAEGETILMPSENGAGHEMSIEETQSLAAEMNEAEAATQEPGEHETVDAQVVPDTDDPNDAIDINDTNTDVETADTSMEESSIHETSATDVEPGEAIVGSVEEPIEAPGPSKTEEGEKRPRRSLRSMEASASRSVVEEIAAAFDDDTPVVTPRRGRPRKNDDSSDGDPDVLHISSPAVRTRNRVGDAVESTHDAEVDETSLVITRGRGRPRKTEESGMKSDGLVHKVLQKTAESVVLDSGSASPLRKRSALSSSQDSPAITPKKQVRINESPSVLSVKSTRTPVSATIPNEMRTPDQVYNFEDDATPSTSGKKLSETPEVAMNMSIETQTEEPEHIEVIYWESSPGKRTVQTQTDPRLKMKKVKVEDSLFAGDESPKKRRRRVEIEEDFGLFEDSKRRLSKRTTEEALKCPFCEKSFIGLVKHIKSRHCEEPDYDEEMRNARWRERIMKVSSGTPETPGDACDDCGKITMNMKRHRESHQMDRMQIPCPMCNKIVLKTGLSSHMRTVHSGRKPYKCPHCDYVSAFRGNLNTHVKGMHLHTRQYLCNVCQAAFKTLGALIGHTKRVHEGWKSPNQKIFICSVCEKRFTKKYHVDRHMLIHTGEKPHKCDDCQRTFNNKSNLMSHIQLVHKRLSPYQCDLCKETFKRKKLLLEHIGRVHVSRGEHIVFRTPMDEAEQEDGDETSENAPPVLQEVNQDALFADGNQVQLATVVSVEEAAHLTEGQHYTTLQTETGEETIIIVHSGDVNDVAQVMMDAGGEGEASAGQQVYVDTME